MFTAGNAEILADATCPVVHLSDSAEDLRPFLRAILPLESRYARTVFDQKSTKLTCLQFPPPRLFLCPGFRGGSNRCCTSRAQVSSRRTTSPGTHLPEELLRPIQLLQLGVGGCQGGRPFRRVMPARLRHRHRRPDRHPRYTPARVLRLGAARRRRARGVEAQRWHHRDAQRRRSAPVLRRCRCDEASGGGSRREGFHADAAVQ